MVFCRDCRFYEDTASGKLCAHPTNVDLVTGSPTKIQCNAMRLAGKACGPEGNLFERKELPIPSAPNA